MPRYLEFNYCAVPVFIIILMTTYLRKTTKGQTNRAFLALGWTSLVATLADIMTEVINNSPSLLSERPFWLEAFHYLYFSVRGAGVWIYLVFIYAFFRMSYKLRRRKMYILLLVPYAIDMLVLFTNPFHHLVFKLEAGAGYQRGPLSMILYIAAGIYILHGISFLLRYRRYVRRGPWWALFSMYLLTILSVGIQYLFPNLLIEMYFTSLVCLLISLIVLRPEDITDPSVGLSNWRAYKSELKKIVEIRHPVQIVAFRFMNADKVRSYLGEELYAGYVVRLAECIEHFCTGKKLHSELYYETPTALYLVVDEPVQKWDALPALSELYETVNASTEEVRESGVRLETKLCAIRFPLDLENEEDIIKLGHDFYGLIPYDEKMCRASEIIGTARYQIENQMDSILSRAIREQKFEMYYQPIYDLKEGAFTTAEALIRLRDELFGQISPGIFIPAAESKGLILPIGNYVLEAVFRFISETNIEALGLRSIEVNLSVGQCMQSDLPDLIQYLQEKYEVAPSMVNFEIIETTYDDIGSIADRNIRRMKEMGYSFVLDDYGTGYSNIQRICTLPLSIIKIDKTMVDAMDGENGMFLLRNVMHMMKDIGKTVIAEGVEDAESIPVLREMGCDFIQGFYYAKPMPGGEFVEFIRQKRMGRLT